MRRLPTRPGETADFLSRAHLHELLDAPAMLRRACLQGLRDWGAAQRAALALDPWHIPEPGPEWALVALGLVERAGGGDRRALAVLRRACAMAGPSAECRTCRAAKAAAR